MSDKHTDALAELRAGLKKLNRTTDCEHLIHQLDAIRATEGQAQTSAAVDEEDFYVSACEVMEQFQQERADRGVEIGTQGSLTDGIAWLYMRLEELERAAQLADSTAPGAPVDRNAVIAECIAACELEKVEADVTDEPTDHSYNLAIKHCVTTLNGMKSAAPTAQQSLTAGGAVPEFLPALFKWLSRVHFKYPTDEGIAAGFGADMRALIAAAPLPQVQSDVEIDRIAQKAADKLMRVWGMRKGDIRAAFISSTKECIYAVIHADQQSVTPSGALADNDGGVK